MELTKRQNLVETVKKELDDCQRMVKQHVGVSLARVRGSETGIVFATWKRV